MHESSADPTSIPAAVRPAFAVIPAFNEAATIEAVVLATLPYVDHVIVVDDGSADETASLATAAGATVLHHEINRGKGGSLVSGIERALELGAAAIVTLDADGQHDPATISGLLSALAGSPDDLVLGARVVDRANMPRGRRWGNAQGNFWLSWATGQPLPDSQSGLRAASAGLWRLILAHCHRHRRFVFESAALIATARSGAMIRHVPVAAIYRPGARPSHYRPARDTLPIIAMVTLELMGRGLAPLDLLRGLGLLAPRPSLAREHRS